MLRIILAICLFFSTSLLHSQEADFILSKFFATQVEDEVLLRWTITAGNTCQDTYVERSEDGKTYERIGLIGGICGSPDASITYEYYDTMPLLNRNNYYRLELGQYGYTSAKTLEFLQYNQQDFLIAPNPMSDHARIMFDNSESQEHKLNIIDFQGRIVLEVVTSSNVFNIYRHQLTAGIYIFKVLLLEEDIFGGKLVVQ